MTQAPATTIATAVRQHGGGRHPLNLQCTAPAGRLQDSRGGFITRRAEGATSSHPLPASCAAAAHPTTGVRRARKLSPSLRSQNRPPAQLVERYGRSRLQLSQPCLQSFNDTRKSAVELPFQGECHLITRRYCSLKAVQLLAEVKTDSQQVRVVRACNNRIEARNYLSNHVHSVFIGAVERSWQRLISYQHLRFPSEKTDLLEGCFSPLQLRSDLISLPQEPLIDWNRYGNYQGNDRTNGLHPPRSVRGQPALLYPVRDRPHQQPESATTNQKPPSSPQAPLPHLPGNLKPRHPQQLHAEINRRSLPAPCHHVQRGAA